MRQLLLKLWSEDRGAIIATEWVFAVTILVIGMAAGLKAVQSAVVTELEDVANAVGALSQSYQFAGTTGCGNSSVTAPSRYTDALHTTNVSVNAQTNSLSFAANAVGVCPD